MVIHRENALKAHQHISYCSIQRNHLKKNTKSDQNIHQDASNCTFFQKFIAHDLLTISHPCPLACVQLISLFLYEKNHIFIQNAIKIYTKAHQL